MLRGAESRKRKAAKETNHTNIPIKELRLSEGEEWESVQKGRQTHNNGAAS